MGELELFTVSATVIEGQPTIDIAFNNELSKYIKEEALQRLFTEEEVEGLNQFTHKLICSLKERV